MGVGHVSPTDRVRVKGYCLRYTSKVNVKGCALYRQVFSMQYERLTLETGRIAVRRYFA